MPPVTLLATTQRIPEAGSKSHDGLDIRFDVTATAPTYDEAYSALPIPTATDPSASAEHENPRPVWREAEASLSRLPR